MKQEIIYSFRIKYPNLSYTLPLSFLAPQNLTENQIKKYIRKIFGFKIIKIKL